MNMVLVNYVSYYATQVRGFLRGLSPEVIEELTGGLEADLIEATADSDIVAKDTDVTLADLVERFGTPESYAKELCESAGIEIPAAGTLHDAARDALTVGKKPRVRLGARVKTRISTWWRAIESIDLNPAVRKFLRDVRPVWWFLRAWALYVILVSFEASGMNRPFPQDLAHWLLLLALFVGSVLLGRFTHATKLSSGWRKAVIGANVVLVLFIPMAMSHGGGSNSDQAWQEGYQMGREDEAFSHASAAGQPQPNVSPIDTSKASNLYVYDAQGDFVPDARIVSESGEPIESTIYPVKVNQQSMSVSLLNVRVDEFGRESLNVFPASFSKIDVETDSCTPQDKEFWQALITGDVSEEWAESATGSVDTEAAGLLQVGNSRAQFKYGDSSFELFVGGETTLTNTNDCLYGFKRSALDGSAAPQIVSLPALIAAESEVTDTDPSTEKDSKEQEDPDKEPLETEKPATDLTKDEN